MLVGELTGAGALTEVVPVGTGLTTGATPEVGCGTDEDAIAAALEV